MNAGKAARFCSAAVLISSRWETVVYVLVSILSGLGLVGKQDMIRAILHTRGLYVEIVTVLFIVMPLMWPVAVKASRFLAPVALAGFAGTILVVYPHVVQLHAVGRGSDQADCVIVAAGELAHGNWPYQRVQLWSHNQMSCGPGWAAIQAPLIVPLGYRFALLVIWAASLISLLILTGWKTTSAFIILVFLSPGTWLSAADGTDF